MLHSPHQYSPDFIEAIVLHVDPERFVCSVKTINGKNLQEVRWLLPTGGYTETGMHITPNVQDKVLISTSLGYPLILGCIPRIGVASGEVGSMTGSSSRPNINSDSNLKGGVVANPNKPSDFVNGDFAYTTRGGGLLAVLSSGLAILKASPLAQIIVTKFEGLVRIVNRNYQRFSDASSRVSTNMKGRLYEWFGADWEISHNRSSTERYQELYGDVAAGEVLRGIPDPSATLPAKDTRIRKQWLKDSSGNSIMIETLYQDGSVTFVIQNAAGTSSSTTTDNNGGWEQRVVSPSATSTVTINPSGISLNYNNVSRGIFDTTQASIESNGHHCRVTASGVDLG